MMTSSGRALSNKRVLGAVTFAILRVTSSAFQPVPPIMSRSIHLEWRRSSSSSVYSAYAPSMTFRSIGDDEDDGTIDSFSPSAQLSYLPNSEHLPPRTKELFTKLTENYVYNVRRHPLTLEQVLQVIEAEHLPLDMPMTLGKMMIDVKQTGDDVDESVAEIFSLAAMYALPKEITVKLLDYCIPGAEQGKARSELQTCRDILADKGWSAVSFPKGLALQVNKKYRPAHASQKGTFSLLLRRQQRRADHAKQAVLEASKTAPPKQRIGSRQDFFRSIDDGLFDKSASGQSPLLVSGNANLYFPKQSAWRSVRQGFRKLTRMADKQYARLKSTGRAGIVSYCFFNLVFYTVGVMWQWQRLSAPVNPLYARSATTVLLKKFAKVFGSLYVASQFAKLPKVIAAVGLTPVAQRVVNATKKNLRVSETVATLLLVGLQYALWLGFVMVPILSEYTQLRRLIELERFVDIKQVSPAFYTVTIGLLQEC